MSKTVLRIWEEYRQLSAEDRREFFDLLRDDPETRDDFIEPVPLAPPGHFANIDTPEEIAEQNEFGRHSGIEVPADLE